jgi:hypothetical protein
LGTDTNGCTGAAFATGGVNTGGEMTGGAAVGALAACTVGTADAGASNVVETAGRATGTATGGTACCWVGRAGAGAVARTTGVACGGADELDTEGRFGLCREVTHVKPESLTPLFKATTHKESKPFQLRQLRMGKCHRRRR